MEYGAKWPIHPRFLYPLPRISYFKILKNKPRTFPELFSTISPSIIAFLFLLDFVLDSFFQSRISDSIAGHAPLFLLAHKIHTFPYYLYPFYKVYCLTLCALIIAWILHYITLHLLSCFSLHFTSVPLSFQFCKTSRLFFSFLIPLFFFKYVSVNLSFFFFWFGGGWQANV